ncbi:MAG: protein-export chaperone SecB [Kangiellaceae bacterium]|nr:protein-export chaperone SecB [Kangiellaceae bacterium]
MTDQTDLTPEAGATNEEQQNLPQAAIQKIYVKDVSFEAPNLPEMFSVEYKPQIKMEMNSKSRKVADDNFEVILTISVKSEIEDKTVFLAEVQQAAILLVKNVSEEQLQHTLSVMGPETLYPYIRETIASLIGKAGFPPVQIAPINFQVLYMQKLQQAKTEAEAGTSAEPETTIQ